MMASRKNLVLLQEVVLSKEKGAMTERLTELFIELVERVIDRKGYTKMTWNEDMKAYALMILCRTWYKFNPEKSDNPFAYYTTCVHSACIQYINRELKEDTIKKDYSEYLDDGTNFW